MNRTFIIALMMTTSMHAADKPKEEFTDNFAGKLGEGWSWIREDARAWRVKDDALEVRVQPGNMWGPFRDAKNLLVRDAPDPAGREVAASVTFANKPTEQYEQADLVWYYDDGNMVKCGQELVDGKLCIVMGRKQDDKCRTIKILPLASTTVTVRIIVKDKTIRGQFKTPDAKEWTEVGQCDVPEKGKPKISLQFYQGPKDVERWVRVTGFQLISH